MASKLDAFDAETDGGDKFGFVVIHYKPYHAKKNNMLYANSEYQLRMYAGPFELTDFAKLVLACGEQKTCSLDNATKTCWSAVGEIAGLIGLPGAIPLEVGYGCFGCKARLKSRSYIASNK